MDKDASPTQPSSVDSTLNSVEITSDSKSQLLIAIDGELANLEVEETRQGWSVWALVLGVASSFWLILDELETRVPNSLNLISLLLLLSLVKVGLALLNSLFSAQIDSTTTDKPQFFALNNKFGIARREIFLHLIENIFFLIVSLGIGSAGAYVNRPAAVLFTCLIFMYSIVLLMSFAKIPIDMRSVLKTEHGIVDRKTIFITAGMAGICLYAVIVAIAIVSQRANIITIADYKISGLITCIIWLSFVLLSSTRKRSIPAQLRQVRRDFAFGKIHSGAATRRIDIILFGTPPEEVLREYFDPIDRSICEADRELDRIYLRVHSIIDQIGSCEEAKALHEFMENANKLSEQAGLIDDAFEDMWKKIRSIEWRLRLVLALGIPAEQIGAALMKVLGQLNDVVVKRKELGESLQALMKKLSLTTSIVDASVSQSNK